MLARSTGIEASALAEGAEDPLGRLARPVDPDGILVPVVVLDPGATSSVVDLHPHAAVDEVLLTSFSDPWLEV